jgi:hypothetical protein
LAPEGREKRLYSALYSTSDAVPFLVLGVTKQPVSGIRTGHEHWIQAGSLRLARQAGFH